MPGAHSSRRRRPAVSCSASHGDEAAGPGVSGISPVARSIIGKKRKQMRVFLYDLLEDGVVDGLYWMDKEKMQFRMPWKHAKKKDYDPYKDAELIKLWAINTNKFGHGQPADPTNWKINFRCALNSLRESIVEVENNEEDDYRVYRFDDSKRGRLKSQCAKAAKEREASSPARSCVSYSSTTSSSSSNSPMESPMSCEEEMDDAFATEVLPTVSSSTAFNGYISTFTGVSGTPGATTTTSATSQAIDHWAPDSNQLYDVESLHQLIANISHLGEDTDCSDALMESLVGSANPNMTAKTKKSNNSRSGGKTLPSDTNPLHAMGLESGSDSGVENDKGECLPDCHEIYVKVCYRGSPVAGMKVDNRPGCRIYFGPNVTATTLSNEEHERLFGCRHLTQLALPSPGQAQSILPSIWYLLDSLQRGIVLEVVNNDIYATRLCHANVYWGAPAHLGDTCALERRVRTRIFNYQLFLQIYTHFRDDPDRTAIAAQPPTPTVLLGVGQPWGPERQLDNNLVMISITHCLAEHLMELLHRHRWESHRPFDTDYLMIDPMDEDDKLVVTTSKQTRERLTRESEESKENRNAGVKLTPLNLSSLPVSEALHTT